MCNNIRILLICCLILVNIGICTSQTQRIFCSVCSCRGDYVSCARGFPPPHRFLKATRTGNSILLVRSDFRLYENFKSSIDRLFKYVIVLDGSQQTNSITTTPTQAVLLYSVYDQDFGVKNTINHISREHSPILTSTSQENTPYGYYTSSGATTHTSSEAVSGGVVGAHSIYTPSTLTTPSIEQDSSTHLTRGVTLKKDTADGSGDSTKPTPISNHSHAHDGAQGTHFFQHHYTLSGIGIGIIIGVFLSISLKYLYSYCIKKRIRARPRPRIARRGLDRERSGDIVEIYTF